ncbi:hypothetical protein [Williamsia soli]|uniref:hypothetical protein n=1 Tax=Williamsia soli TaxID=364929 RepID=UPI001A9F7B4E|nr:hypothetical protein [Williamsia soli]
MVREYLEIIIVWPAVALLIVCCVGAVLSVMRDDQLADEYAELLDEMDDFENHPITEVDRGEIR